MRIAVSADENNGLHSVVSPHFGRCPYYVLVDLDGQEVKQVNVVANPNYGRHAPGTVPKLIQAQDADVMLAGGMGRRAVALFEQFGIQAATGASGTVRHALEQYLSGGLQGAEPCLTSQRHGHDDSREEAETLQEQLTDVMQRLDKLTSS